VFSSLRSRIFLLARTGTGSHNDPLLIVKKMAEETPVTSTTQCTLGMIQDGGQELAKQCFSSHNISRVMQNKRIALPVKNLNGKKLI